MIALTLLLGLVVAVSMEWISMLKGAMLVAGIMMFTRCVGLAARRSVDWEVLVAIAASFATRHGAGKDRGGQGNRRSHDTPGQRRSLDFAGGDLRHYIGRDRVDHQQRGRRA